MEMGELSLPILEQLCKKEESGSARMQVTSIRERELQRGKDARIKIRPRCGQCIGCLQEVNCGECTSCRNKALRGVHRTCMYRVCQKLKYTPKDPRKIPSSAARQSQVRCDLCIGCLRNKKEDDCGHCEPCQNRKWEFDWPEMYWTCIYRECQKLKYTTRAIQSTRSAAAVSQQPKVKRKLDAVSIAATPRPAAKRSADVSGGSAAKKRLDNGAETEMGAVSVLYSGEPSDDSSQATSDIAGSMVNKLDSKPKLPELLKFPGKNGTINIPQLIGTDLLALGILLLDDDDGRRVDAIAEKNGSLGILKSWVQGEGRQPVTWRTLVEVLRESDLTILAGEIEGVKSSLIYVLD